MEFGDIEGPGVSPVTAGNSLSSLKLPLQERRLSPGGNTQAPQRKDGLQAAPRTLGEQKPAVTGWPQLLLAPLCVTSDRSLPFSELSGYPTSPCLLLWATRERVETSHCGSRPGVRPARSHRQAGQALLGLGPLSSPQDPDNPRTSHINLNLRGTNSQRSRRSNHTRGTRHSHTPSILYLNSASKSVLL